jgi:Ni/Fe-hydrogenase subunit HybB-like protein
VLLAFLYLYFNINEYLVPAFKMKKPEEAHLTQLFAGEFAPLFWFAIIVGMVIPVIVLLTKKGRKPLPMFIIGICVVVGAWFKRYLIVTPTMLHPFLPMQDVPGDYKHYFPSWEEWAIAIGSLAGALLIITFFVRVFPIVPIHETIEEKELTTQHIAPHQEGLIPKTPVIPEPVLTSQRIQEHDGTPGQAIPVREPLK